MIDAEKALTEQCSELSNSTDSLKVTLGAVQAKYKSTMSGVESMVSELRATMALDVEGMDCTEADEIHIIEMIESAGRKLDMFLQENASSESVIKEVLGLLERLAAEQNKIIEDTLIVTLDVEENVMGEVELF